MAESPLIILIELFVGIIKNTLDTLGFVGVKLVELFASLLLLSKFGIFGILIAAVIGVSVFFFLTKFILKSSGTLVRIGLALIVVLGILILLSLLL